MTFEEWAEPNLGPLVWGVNEQEWAKCWECWEAAQLAAGYGVKEGNDATNGTLSV